MHRFRGLSRGGRLLLALAVGGAIFGIASAVQADIPDSGVIHGCYGKSGTPYKGNLRVRDASQGEQCRYYENPLDWNQTGPTGPTGPAGPTFVATGLVFPDGTVDFTSGPVPTVTHLATGQYEFAISGMGTGCPLPQLTSYGPNGAPNMSFQGGPCGGGLIDTTVYTSNAADSFWVYMVVGVGGGAHPVHKTPLPTG
jgi:hypothetical protein